VNATPKAAPVGRWRVWKTWPLDRARREEAAGPPETETAALKRAVVLNCDRFALGEPAANYEARKEP
jgi:hypothetical protein